MGLEDEDEEEEEIFMLKVLISMMDDGPSRCTWHPHSTGTGY